jgi:hypothetical protein
MIDASKAVQSYAATQNFQNVSVFFLLKGVQAGFTYNSEILGKFCRH